MIKRREALAIGAGLAISSLSAEPSMACSQRPYFYRAGRGDVARMAQKLRALRQDWNAGNMDDFFARHCTEHVEVNFYLDGKGGNWARPDHIELFRQRYPRIVSDFSDAMTPGSYAAIYACAEFEYSPPPDWEPEFLPCGVRAAPAFAVELRFETERSGDGFGSIIKGQRIVEMLSLRDTWLLRNFFDE